MHVTKASAACSRTVKSSCSEMQTSRSIVNGGEPAVLMEKEVLTLSEREEVSFAEGRHHEHCYRLGSSIGYKSQPDYSLEQNETS